MKGNGLACPLGVLGHDARGGAHPQRGADLACVRYGVQNTRSRVEREGWQLRVLCGLEGIDAEATDMTSVCILRSGKHVRLRGDVRGHNQHRSVW